MVEKSSFGFEESQYSPGFCLWQATIVWQRLIKKAVEPHGVSHAQFVLLAILLWMEEHHKQSTQAVLVKMSKLDKMTVSKALNALCEKELMIRTESAIDSRTKVANLTSKGRTLIQQLVPIVEAVDTQFFGGLAKANQKHLTQALALLVE
jgi:DNA-binding MarR family transcriptional regulator